jgi:gluconokinase
MIEPIVAALDVGTSSVRATLYDGTGAVIEGRFHQGPCPPATTRDGGVAHDAERLFETLVASLDAVQDGIRAPIAAVGVSTFWHGLLGFDNAGRPVTPLYSWADTRATRDAEQLRSAVDERALHARTGCHLHSGYWPAKLRWLARERAHPSIARWGSLGELLELRLFGDAATSVSMASGTGLFDQEQCRWDPEALALARVETSQLFPLTDRDRGRRGLRSPWGSRWPALRDAVWFPAIGDGAASSVGSDCVDAHRMALNVGTSCALRLVGPSVAPPRGLWRYRLDRERSLVGGATSEGGNLHAWCKEHLKLPSDDATEAALAAPDFDGPPILALPFFAGERSPGWRGDRRGALAGLALDTTATDILRALLEAVAVRLALVYDLLAPLAASDHVIVASGGALAHSPAWARMIADAIGRPIRRSRESEASSRGAARVALAGLGAIADVGAMPATLGETIEPDPARHARFRELRARQTTLDERI